LNPSESSTAAFIALALLAVKPVGSAISLSKPQEALDGEMSGLFPLFFSPATRRASQRGEQALVREPVAESGGGSPPLR
jgi:hypothetical protein